MCSCRSFLACNQKEFHLFVFFETNILDLFLINFGLEEILLDSHLFVILRLLLPRQCVPLDKILFHIFKNILIFIVLFVCVPLDKILFHMF